MSVYTHVVTCTLTIKQCNPTYEYERLGTDRGVRDPNIILMILRNAHARSVPRRSYLYVCLLLIGRRFTVISEIFAWESEVALICKLTP